MSGVRLWMDSHHALVIAWLGTAVLGTIGATASPRERQRLGIPVTLSALIATAALLAGEGRLETWLRTTTEIDHARVWAAAAVLAATGTALIVARHPAADPRRAAAAAASAAVLVAVLAITLDPAGTGSGGLSLALAPGSITQATYDTAPNAVLLLPLAYLARLAWRSSRPVLLALAALSLGLELAQLPLGRSVQALDILANVVGAGTGVLFAQWQTRTSRGEPQAARP